MPENVKALIYVLVLLVPAFYISGKIAGSEVSKREFAFWRNAWFIGTIAAFLFGNILYFLLVLAIICIHAHTARVVSIALFVVLLFFAPPIKAQLGGLGLVNRTIDLNNVNVLSIGLLLPLLFTAKKVSQQTRDSFTISDRLIILYVVLRIVLLPRQPDFGVGFIRNVVAIPLDILVPYFACSRVITKMADFRKVLLAFVVGVLPLALIGVFESTRHWLLYNSVIVNWRTLEWVESSEREGMIRGAATAGPIILGTIIIVAIGCLLALRRTTKMPRNYSGIALTILVLGEIATLSRGPWVGAMIMISVYLLTSPHVKSHILQLILIAPVAVAFLLLTPIGDRLIEFIPFLGIVDAGSVTYRQRLFESSIQVIGNNPWFGSVDYKATPQMQELASGQHIIDIVNTYLRVALDAGLIGLGLFFGVFLTILVRLWRVIKLGTAVGEGIGDYGRALMAVMIGILVTIATVSSISFLPYVYWSFAGLCVAFIRIAYRKRAAVVRMAVADQIAR